MKNKTPKQKKKINMSKVSKDIIELKFDDDDTIKDCYEKFFKLMIKHNIKQGTETEHGILRDNYEWTACVLIFKDRLLSHIDCQFTFGDVIPKELEY